MNNKCKVVLLPTDKESNLRLFNKTVQYYENKHNFGHMGVSMYILSDDEIKEGDWMYHKLDKSPTKFLKDINNPKEDPKYYGYRKIIATTNPDLIKEGVTSIDDEFIKNYCNNPVEEVNVVYEEFTPGVDDSGYGFPTGNSIIQPKLSSNGYIITKPIEETWDEIYSKFRNENGYYTFQYIEWLKENYEVPKKK